MARISAYSDIENVYNVFTKIYFFGIKVAIRALCITSFTNSMARNCAYIDIENVHAHLPKCIFFQNIYYLWS